MCGEAGLVCRRSFFFLFTPQPGTTTLKKKHDYQLIFFFLFFAEVSTKHVQMTLITDAGQDDSSLPSSLRLCSAQVKQQFQKSQEGKCKQWKRVIKRKKKKKTETRAEETKQRRGDV